MISEDLFRSYRSRARALEDSTRRLVSEILEELPPDASRIYRRRLSASLEIHFNAIEEALVFGRDPAAALDDTAVDRIRELSDQLLYTRSELDRIRRDVRHQEEDLELEGRKKKNRQVQEELESAGQ